MWQGQVQQHMSLAWAKEVISSPSLDLTCAQDAAAQPLALVCRLRLSRSCFCSPAKHSLSRLHATTWGPVQLVTSTQLRIQLLDLIATGTSLLAQEPLVVESLQYTLCAHSTLEAIQYAAHKHAEFKQAAITHA